MAFKSTYDYIDILTKLAATDNVPNDVIGFLNSYITKIYRSDEESKYSKPMLWIGMYIALASLICILAMVGDLLHGLRTRKLWFPCKYFTINSASLTVIAVAMKLPVDLTTSMPGDVDQLAKLGSMAFMCSMMANLLPSLATMDIKALFSNTVALVILVITLVVNICIQMATGVISYEEKVKINKIVKRDLDPKSMGTYENFNKITATIYVTLLLMLLIIHICSYLAILLSKQIIERQYEGHAGALAQQRLTTYAETKQSVSKYWIMGGTRSPHFIRICSATTSASGVICVLSTILHIFTVLKTSPKLKSKYCESDYQWSMLVILVTQFIGVVVGTIAPLSRCFAALSFSMFEKGIWNHINVFKTEFYWTQKLSEWKSIPIPFRSRKWKVVIEKLKFMILSFLKAVQVVVVVTCKMISLIPFFCTTCVSFMMCRASRAGSGKNTHQREKYDFYYLSRYVLQLDEELEPDRKTLTNSLMKSVNRLIEKAEKQQPNNLMKLLEKSSGFEGVLKFDNDHVPTISSKQFLGNSSGFEGVEKFDSILEEIDSIEFFGVDGVKGVEKLQLLHCWSLPVVTLTAIVVSLPNIQKDKADNFLKSVSEAFMYVTLVEESLNNASINYVRVQQAAKTLWLEVEILNKWLGHKLNDCFHLSPPKKDSVYEVSIRDILQWFSNRAKSIVIEVGSTESGGPNSIHRSICANSMYRITKTIMLSYQDINDQVSQEDLFAQLSSMISDIVAACLTNLPQVITLRCHANQVHAAAQLLGETRQIIQVLEDHELPRLNPGDFPFIHKWRAYLRHP